MTVKFAFGVKSQMLLKTVHPDLVKVCKRALILSDTDFGIIQGLRTVAEEADLVAKGLSHTMNSRHLPGPDGFARAVDYMVYVNGHGVWTPLSLYEKVAKYFIEAGQQLKIPVVYGGNWRWKDSDHIELDRSVYP